MTMMVRERKLSDDQVRAIRGDDRSLAELARLYNINQVTIWRIKTGRRKAGVPDVAPDPALEARDKPQDKKD